jgi:catechol 2,3-dioxygenase-like lactoylglutathione lyase family enzyme
MFADTYSKEDSVISKLSHATVYVIDQDAAYDFYVNKLDFEVRNDTRLDNGFRWLAVGPKGQPDLELVLFEIKSGDSRMSEEAVAQMRSLLQSGVMGPGVFQTEDCRATYEELKARGVEFLSPPQEQFYGIEATFQDNSGNFFSLTQPTQ